jgi:penicillin-binding protein 1A
MLDCRLLLAGTRTKPRLKKLRVLFVLLGLAALAVVSMVFGMVVAVSKDLPAIYNFAQYQASKNSEVFDASGEPIGTLTSNENKILLTSGQISPNVKNAVVSVEDARYYDHDGVDFQGIGRALVKDIISRSAAQGASTITEQFVKEALEAQGERTVFQKFREAALAYRLEHHWSKDKILTEYLNTIYFGEGAYGIEAAARTFFGAAHPGCGSEAEPCASVLEPWEAAMLAGIISSPSLYDPKIFPENALARRNLVLERMHEQGYITAEQRQEGSRQALPAPSEIEPPTLDSEAPYFTAWLRQQLVERFGAAKTFFGGLKVKTTLDLRLQAAAEETVGSYLSGLPPTAAIVVIDNRNAGVKAMVAGPDFEEQPFNLATLGHRQPGSSIKPIILATALQQGISPETVYESAPQTFSFGKKGQEAFEVNNYEDSYLGSASLATATTYSDNAVYAQVGLESIRGGTRAIARTARRLGVRTHLSTNPAMVLGGLAEGVTPLEWTYAFSTLANDGDRVSGTLAPKPGASPVAYTEVTDDDGALVKGGDNDSTHTRVLPPEVAEETKSILRSVVTSGTGVRADVGDESQWGKTGTTDENIDAWFCGATEEVTACVWVGYADSATPMETEFSGGPVDGGTFPALIWAGVISAWQDITADRAAERKTEEDARESEDEEGDSASPSTSEDSYTQPPTEQESAPAPDSAPEPESPEPAPAPEEAPEATPESAPESGSGGGITAG